MVDWVTIYGSYMKIFPQGDPPVFYLPPCRRFSRLHPSAALLCLIASLFEPRRAIPAPQASQTTWKQLRILLGSFSLAYLLLLVHAPPRRSLTATRSPSFCSLSSAHSASTRTASNHAVPSAAWLAVGLFAIYGIVCNT